MQALTPCSNRFVHTIRPAPPPFVKVARRRTFKHQPKKQWLLYSTESHLAAACSPCPRRRLCRLGRPHRPPPPPVPGVTPRHSRQRLHRPLCTRERRAQAGEKNGTCRRGAGGGKGPKAGKKVRKRRARLHSQRHTRHAWSPHSRVQQPPSFTHQESHTATAIPAWGPPRARRSSRAGHRDRAAAPLALPRAPCRSLQRCDADAPCTTRQQMEDNPRGAHEHTPDTTRHAPVHAPLHTLSKPHKQALVHPAQQQSSAQSSSRTARAHRHATSSAKRHSNTGEREAHPAYTPVETRATSATSTPAHTNTP